MKIEILGVSAQMKQALSVIRKFATSNAPVLITGESGTGKELAARSIHECSATAEGPFIPINCGAIPETLLESELFGHEKGAFTGAHAQKKGKVELAHGGTLFLDEVGELPFTLQVKLLRFLEDYRFERVGGNQLLEVKIRVISASNKDLGQVVKEGNFREDLYYRLSVLAVALPALRERREDLIILAQSFLKRYVHESQSPIKGFSPQAMDAIRNYQWPGNVRELLNTIRRAVVMAEGEWITPADMGVDDARDENPPLSLASARQRVEREFIKSALARNGGNISRAAHDLAVSRPHLYGLMKKYNLYETVVASRFWTAPNPISPKAESSHIACC